METESHGQTGKRDIPTFRRRQLVPGLICPPLGTYKCFTICLSFTSDRVALLAQIITGYYFAGFFHVKKNKRKETDVNGTND